MLRKMLRSYLYVFAVMRVRMLLYACALVKRVHLLLYIFDHVERNVQKLPLCAYHYTFVSIVIYVH